MSGSAKREDGQVLVLVALMLVALLGFAALAVDVSGLYAERRVERAVADAAALAGAQDNFRAGTTTVDNTEWTKARTHSMQTAISQLKGVSAVTVASLPTCSGQAPPYASDVVNCPIAGTPYYVSIAAPAPTCLTLACDYIHSVQVTIRNPRHSVVFARLFGQSTWNAVQTSVAERSHGTNYSFVALRPPKPSRANNVACAPNCDDNANDVNLSGVNTQLTVHGDMATNTNMVLTNGATVTVDAGSFVYRYDAYKAWAGNPLDKQISTPIADPMYPYPAPPLVTDVARNFSDESTARLDPASCKTEVAKIPASYVAMPGGLPSAADVDADTVACYKPGAYNFTSSFPPSQIRTVVFSPGVYFLNKGFQPGNNVRVIGGYDASTSGVAFVLPPTCNPSCTFAGNAVPVLVANAGAAYPTGSGARPSAAQNWDGSLVQTNGRTPVPMSFLVSRDPLCVVAATDTCPNENQNNQLRLPGGGSIFVFGVQYAPSDNVAINGGSGSSGYLGQIWAWTVTYTGGSNINLTSASNQQPGVLRIATPCSPGTSCINPEATVAIP